MGQAHGLCFSVKPDVDIPPSLVNIYQELHDDLGCYIPNNGYLVKWAEQGVLMLNTVLTVRAHMPILIMGKAGKSSPMLPSGFECTGPPNRIYSVGETGTDEKKHAE